MRQFSSHVEGDVVSMEKRETLLNKNTGIMENFILGMTNQCEDISME